MSRILSAKAKTKPFAHTRFDPIRSWSRVLRELIRSSALNKEDWDITLSSGIEVSINDKKIATFYCLLVAIMTVVN